MRMRLKGGGSALSPTKALETLRRIQQHRTTLGDKQFVGLSKQTPEQAELLDTLNLPKPPRSAV
jgi:hypothetical protein